MPRIQPPVSEGERLAPVILPAATNAIAIVRILVPWYGDSGARVFGDLRLDWTFDAPRLGLVVWWRDAQMLNLLLPDAAPVTLAKAFICPFSEGGAWTAALAAVRADLQRDLLRMMH